MCSMTFAARHGRHRPCRRKKASVAAVNEAATVTNHHSATPAAGRELERGSGGTRCRASNIRLACFPPRLAGGRVEGENCDPLRIHV